MQRRKPVMVLTGHLWMTTRSYISLPSRTGEQTTSVSAMTSRVTEVDIPLREVQARLVRTDEARRWNRLKRTHRQAALRTLLADFGPGTIVPANAACPTRETAQLIEDFGLYCILAVRPGDSAGETVRLLVAEPRGERDRLRARADRASHAGEDPRGRPRHLDSLQFAPNPIPISLRHAPAVLLLPPLRARLALQPPLPSPTG